MPYVPCFYACLPECDKKMKVRDKEK